MRAVILAAGAGRRLQPLIGPRPKCLARIGDTTLIERQIRQLRDCGVADVTVVVGYLGDEVVRICGGVDVIRNIDYAATNSLYSLWLARECLGDGFVVLNADVLFHSTLLARLLESPHEDALLVDVRQPGVRYSDEEMKVHIVDGRVAAIDKHLADTDADGENVGIAKFGAAGAAALRACVEALVAEGAVREWLPRAFDAVCRTRPLHVVATGSDPWIEIDFPEDYARACRDIWPAIAASDLSAAGPLRFTDDAVASTFGRVLHRV